MKIRVLHQTLHGPVVILWEPMGDGPKIIRILLTRPDMPSIVPAPGSFEEESCDEIDLLACGLVAFFEGEKIRFSLDSIHLKLCTPFQRTVLHAEHAIPRGSVSTYGLIARQIGKPNAARAVGNALARNPFPIIIPCHRALRSDGTLGGYQGGEKMKRSLLLNEGISFDDANRVEINRFHYQ